MSTESACFSSPGDTPGGVFGSSRRFDDAMPVDGTIGRGLCAIRGSPGGRFDSDGRSFGASNGRFRVEATCGKALGGAMGVHEFLKGDISFLRLRRRERTIAIKTIAIKPSPPITPPIIAGIL